MARALLSIAAIDESGEDIEGATIAFTKVDGSALGVSLYAAESGGAAVTTHTTNSLGMLDRYVDVPMRARFSVNGGTPVIRQFDPDPADILLQHLTVPATLDGLDSNSAWALTARNLASEARAFRVQDDDGTDILQVRKSTSGNNVIMSNLLDATIPTLSLIYVAKPIVASQESIVRLTGVAGAAGLVEQKTLEVTMSQTIAGAGNLAAAKFTATRGALASVGETVALKAIVNSSLASGSPKLNVGVWAEALGSQRSDTGVLIHGAAGWTQAIRYYETDGTTILFDVGQTGIVTTLGVSYRAAGNILMGGGATATLGTIGGSGPTIAAQAGWIKDYIAGTPIFRPYWN